MSLWVFGYQGVAPATGYWLMEDGSRWMLEDGSGYWVLG